jgi:hypothetical protein
VTANITRAESPFHARAAETIEYAGVKVRLLYHHDAERAAGIAEQLVPDSGERKLDEMLKCKKSE